MELKVLCDLWKAHIHFVKLSYLVQNNFGGKMNENFLKWLTKFRYLYKTKTNRSKGNVLINRQSPIFLFC